MLTPLRRFGDHGEDLAAAYLEKNGYRIMARQVRVGRMGELDLICRQGATIVFVEVKTRSSDAFGTPEDAMGQWKRNRFRRSIESWLLSHHLSEAAFRADVVAVDLSRPSPVIRHHQGIELL